jgi:hypothetical protein
MPLFEDGYDMRTVQEPLGHKDVQRTPNYTHVLNRGERAVHGPPRPALEACLRRDPWDYADPPVRVRLLRETCGIERKWLHGKHLPPAAGRWRFRLRPTRGGFRQVGPNRS